MYLRRCYRQKDGKRHGYWALVESYRTSRGPRQRVVAYLGEMDAAGRLGLHQQAAGPAAVAQRRLFGDVEPQWVEVDLKRIAVERKRAFGGPWLGLQLCRRVGLVDFIERTLATGKEEIPWPLMAQILILARLCNPSSELHIAEHFYESSALSDLLGVAAEKVNEDRLYRALDQLLPHKEALEKHLKNRLGELFELDYDLLLYDVTSTYFEGEAKQIPLAQRGYSRDHRPDCKQVNIALVVSREGIPLGYQLFAGNRNDVTTLEEIVDRIEEGLEKIAVSCRKRKQEPVVVAQRVGRLLGQNSRAAGAFHVQIVPDANGLAKFSWKKVDRWRQWARLSEGCYLLRSNVMEWSPEELWRVYIQLTEAEAAFHIQKSDLQLRPIWHKKLKRVEAHILVCFLAYVLWKTLAQLCHRAGLGNEPRKVFQELAEVTLVDVLLPTRSGVTIRKRCVSRPTEHQAILLQRLGLQLPSSLEAARM